MPMTRTDLQRIVDELPDDKIDIAAQLLEAYDRGDRALVSMLLAPEVEAEPWELEALREAEQMNDGKTYTLEEVRRELGFP
jgi:hypothetical protein